MKYTKFSNIDYKKYIDFKNRIETFSSFISYILKPFDKKWSAINSLFEDIDSFIKDKFELKEESKNFFGTIFTLFSPKKAEPIKNENQTLIDYNEYIKIFIDVLNERKLKGKQFIMGESEKNKIIEYINKYLELKKNLKNNIYYKHSFYEEFRDKFNEIINSADETLNNKFDKYVEDILMKTNYYN